MAIYNKTELYFFKFPNTFFDKDEIELFEDDIEGDSVIVLYLKLITLATNKNGYLCKIIAGEVIPYTTEELCRKTNTSLDDFQRRLKKLKNVGLIVIKDDMLFIEEALNYTNWIYVKFLDTFLWTIWFVFKLFQFPFDNINFIWYLIGV